MPSLWLIEGPACAKPRFDPEPLMSDFSGYVGLQPPSPSCTAWCLRRAEAYLTARSSTSGEDAWQSVNCNELIMKPLAVSHRLSCLGRCLPARSLDPAPVCCPCGCWGCCRSSPEKGCFQTWAYAQFDKPSFISTFHQTISQDITWGFF